MEALLPHLSALLGTLILAAVPLLLQQLFAWLRTKNKSARYQVAMGQIEDAVTKGAIRVSQEYVTRMKVTGQWGGESALAARDSAVSYAKEWIGDGGLKQLATSLGKSQEDLDKMIITAVESAVAKMKEPRT